MYGSFGSMPHDNSTTQTFYRLGTDFTDADLTGIDLSKRPTSAGYLQPQQS
jgi:hypothetical protein